MPSRTRTAERYARGFTAALVAVATLLLAANAGPAKASEASATHATHPVDQRYG
ncbi:hypothetical protein ABZ408_01900 [Streptomyces tibetensis]|uniref:hypothetical protein n=1 Tax=Streptomyces tibetensis TaxID=2382123 RepID=UPI0033CC243C